MNETYTDNFIISHALTLWANYIETGDVCISAIDAHAMKQKEVIKPLTVEQMKLIIRMREMAKKKFKLV